MICLQAANILVLELLVHESRQQAEPAAAIDRPDPDTDDSLAVTGGTLAVAPQDLQAVDGNVANKSLPGATLEPASLDNACRCSASSVGTLVPALRSSMTPAAVPSNMKKCSC